MIKDYLYSIGQYLPSSQREDILKEIESSIYDYLDERYGKKDYSQTEIESAILNLGNPRKVAHGYINNPGCLIGPTYIDIYLTVIKMAFIGISIGIFVSFAINMIVNGSILNSIFGFFASITQASLMMFAIVTLIFAVIERYGLKEKELEEEDNHWTIDELKKAPSDTNVVKISELIFEIIFIFLFLAIINNYLLGFKDSTVFLMPLNIQVLSPFIIWINVILIFNLLLDIYLLIKREWSVITRILAIISDLVGLGIFALIAFSPNLIDFEKIKSLDPEIIEAVKISTWIGFRIGFLTILVITIFETYRHIKALLKNIKH